MRDKQESITIIRAACVTGLAASAAIAAGGAFLDLVNPLYDAEAPRLLPAAALLALKALPVCIALSALYGLGAHFYLKRHGMTREVHYILAAMLGLYAPFVAGSFLVGPGDGPMMLLTGGVPVSFVLSFPLGMTFRRLVVMPRLASYGSFESVGMSYFARFIH
jgi:hypothetical protein